jgi:hypothetical protein
MQQRSTWQKLDKCVQTKMIWQKNLNCVVQTVFYCCNCKIFWLPIVSFKFFSKNARSSVCFVLQTINKSKLQSWRFRFKFAPKLALHRLSNQTRIQKMNKISLNFRENPLSGTNLYFCATLSKPPFCWNGTGTAIECGQNGLLQTNSSITNWTLTSWSEMLQLKMCHLNFIQLLQKNFQLQKDTN